MRGHTDGQQEDHIFLISNFQLISLEACPSVCSWPLSNHPAPPPPAPVGVHPSGALEMSSLGSSPGRCEWEPTCCWMFFWDVLGKCISSYIYILCHITLHIYNISFLYMHDLMARSAEQLPKHLQHHCSTYTPLYTHGLAPSHFLAVAIEMDC